ncbi:MAG: RNA 2',3'-cyclic phosphodiesterase [Candidatus Zixiibacteriota bacterium]
MRLFIAIPLPKPTEQYLADIIRTLRKPGDGIKWVDPRNIHLTIRFLGDTEGHFVPLISKELSEVARVSMVVICKLGGVGAFPNLNRPRVIWVGLENNVDMLKNTASDLEERMRTIGFAPEDKPFKPHLTLGRVREGAPQISIAVEAISHMKPAEPVRLDKMILYQSTLTPQGPIYKSLFTAEFS